MGKVCFIYTDSTSSKDMMHEIQNSCIIHVRKNRKRELYSLVICYNNARVFIINLTNTYSHRS
uniref:Uncharacterized protein n=1 Tax=Octopus bimaculoides TaxID=37653 RepID=A0A0L8HIE3_OCTBM